MRISRWKREEERRSGRDGAERAPLLSPEHAGRAKVRDSSARRRSDSARARWQSPAPAARDPVSMKYKTGRPLRLQSTGRARRATSEVATIEAYQTFNH